MRELTEFVFCRQQTCVWYSGREAVCVSHRHIGLDGASHGALQAGLERSHLASALQVPSEVSANTDWLVTRGVTIDRTVDASR